MDETATWHDRDLSHFRRSTGTDLFDVHDHFRRWLLDARPAGYELYEQGATSAPTTRIALEGLERPLINLASYNYLGLSYRPEVLEAAGRALARFGLGAAGSPHLSGLLEVHTDLSRELAEFKGTEAAMLFPSGYAANVGAISALVGPDDVVITDILAHASIMDGAVLSQARMSLFRHNDMESLAQKLSRANGRKLVIVEGVYSMDGDVAPLREIVALCRAHGARLMVDEAHSAFVFGEHGRGLVEHLGVEDDVDIHLGTLSKSLGGMGGYVAGSQELIDYLRAYSRSQIFSCALAPPVVGGLREALRIARAEPELRVRLWENVRVMHDALVAQGVDVGASTSQVIPILIRDDRRIFDVAKDLLRSGVYLNPVRYPAVKRHQSRFRVSISACHQPAELIEAAAIIGEVLRRHEVLS